MNTLEKPFVLEMLNDIKDYYQMPAFWRDREKNYFIAIGYCPSCDEITNLTEVRRTSDGSDCLGEHCTNHFVPLQCFDLRHEGAIEFSPKRFNSLLKYLTFFNKNKKFLGEFELKKIPNVEITNKTYEVFRDLINAWENDEIKEMHNVTYILKNILFKLQFYSFYSFYSARIFSMPEISFLYFLMLF